MFKSVSKTFTVISTVAALTVATGFMSKAHATDCVYPQGSEICFQLETSSNTRGNQVWLVRVRNRHNTEKMIVECDGRRWVQFHSFGKGTKSQVRSFVRHFCQM